MAGQKVNDMRMAFSIDDIHKLGLLIDKFYRIRSEWIEIIKNFHNRPIANKRLILNNKQKKNEFRKNVQ